MGLLTEDYRDGNEIDHGLPEWTRIRNEELTLAKSAERRKEGSAPTARIRN